MQSKNPWDSLSDYFDTSKGDVARGAEDNILTAWPVILKFIRSNISSSDNKKVLEFGCGGGGFAKKLHSLGFEVVGMDSAKEMIKIGRKNYGNEIKFIVGDSRSLVKLRPFDLITSVMTLQFITDKDIEKTISNFSHVLKLNGFLIFAVHNYDFIKEGLESGRYIDFDSKSTPRIGKLKFENGITIPLYIRSAEEYNKLAKKYGLVSILDERPFYPKDFIAKYPQYSSQKYPKYLILGYKKS